MILYANESEYIIEYTFELVSCDDLNLKLALDLMYQIDFRSQGKLYMLVP